MEDAEPNVNSSFSWIKDVVDSVEVVFWFYGFLFLWCFSGHIRDIGLDFKILLVLVL